MSTENDTEIPEVQDKPKPSKPKKKGSGCLKVLGIMLVLALLITGVSMWWVKHNVYASPLDPVVLSQKEVTKLQEKLERLERASMQAAPSNNSLKPEAYSEDDAKREIRITEKELNSLIAENKKWADKVAIDLSADLLSLTLLIPVDEEFPIIGGTTARITAGATLRYENERPVVILRGISLGGVPLPSAWMGDIKNKNLLDEFGGQGGFWDAFSDGIANIEVREGHLYLKLKE